VIKETNATTGNITDYLYGDDLIKQTKAANDSYYLYDGLGSTRALTNSTGTITDSYNYESFGSLLNQVGTTENNYLFTGEQFDKNLDNYYLRARYYDQNVGRFMQMDTWMGNNQDPVTLHKYLYANVDPVNNIDPTGNFTLVSVMKAVNVVSTLATVGQTAYNIFEISNGTKELSAADVGLGIVFGLANKVGGKYASIYAKKYANSLKKFISGIGCNSFSENTLVTTANGLVEIRNIKIGDEVLTYNENTGEQEYNNVIHIISSDKLKEILSIELSNGDILESTSGHLIYVDEEWIAAEDIELGQSLFSLGEKVTVSNVVLSTVKVKVYNLTVDGNHNYFVGENGVLVHNISKCEKAAKELAAMVPNKYCVHGSCGLYAKSLKDFMKQNGVKGQHLEIKVGKGVRVYSDKHGGISDRGLGHEAIRVGDIVFDNKWPNGISYKKWIKDLGGPGYLDGSSGAKLIVKENF
jgi:RHS repeat-associated protein